MRCSVKRKWGERMISKTPICQICANDKANGGLEIMCLVCSPINKNGIIELSEFSYVVDEKETKQSIKEKYVELLCIADMLGFNDDDWNDANRMVDELRAKKMRYVKTPQHKEQHERTI
jgi:hypothetical protein